MQPKEMFDVLAAHFGPETVFDFHADPKKDKDPWFQVKPYEIEAVDLKTKVTASGADFMAINPKGYVPALQLDNGDLLTDMDLTAQLAQHERTGARATLALGIFPGHMLNLVQRAPPQTEPAFNTAAPESTLPPTPPTSRAETAPQP